jgi:ribosomal protein L7/L12
MAGAVACPYCGVAFEGAPVGAGAAPPRLAGGQAADPDILDLLARGNKIEAIRIYRERYRPRGLKEAKDAVEAIEARMKGP